MLLGDIIKNYRKEHKMSLQDFADLIHSSRSYVHMLEKNFNPSTGKPISPSIETLRSISSAMCITIESLLKQLDTEQYIYLNETEYKNQFKDFPTERNLNTKIDKFGNPVISLPILRYCKSRL